MDIKNLYLKSPNHDVITIYIAKDSSSQKTLSLLKHEEPIVQNIKSRVTRQAIEEAFQKIKSFLANPPPSENGYIIVSSGNDFVWTNQYQVTKDYYRCGNEFYSAPLEEILALKLYPIGILCIDSKEATIGYISSKVEILKYMTSGIPGKHSKGGQSQRRFEREREMELGFFFKRVADSAKVFLDSYPIEELIVAGEGPTKNKFLDTKYLDYRLKNKLNNIIDVPDAGEEGIRETLHKALPLLEKNAYAREIKIVEEIFELLGKNFERVVYGKEDIERKLGRISKIIKVEENSSEYKKETEIIRFHGEHYEKLLSLGGIVGIISDLNV